MIKPVLPAFLRIGDVLIDPPVMLAPMAGVSDRAFRILCKEMGMGMCTTEFVSAEGIVRDNEKTLEMMRFTEQERPIAVQIFGADPKVMAEAAVRVEQEAAPDILDLNFGCPVPKVVKKGAGAALLKDMEKLAAVTEAVVKAADIPVTVKMRSGWDEGSIIAVEAALMMESAGVAALTLHPRTAKMGYRGKADWSLIAAVKQKLRIPVIGNGDVNTAEDAEKMFSEGGCDAVMIGRGALGNPWIFQELAYLFQGETGWKSPGVNERFDLILRHLAMMLEDYGEHGYKMFKSHFAWYCSGLPGAARARSAVNSSLSPEEMIAGIESFRDDLTAIYSGKSDK